MNAIDNLEYKRTHRIKNIMVNPPNKRTNRQILEIMNYTKVI